MEWRTYTPDGRQLDVKREKKRWIAICGGHRAESESLRAAMTEAVGVGRGDVLPTAGSRESVERWIAEHAARMEREAGESGGEATSWPREA